MGACSVVRCSNHEALQRTTSLKVEETKKGVEG